MTGSTLFRYFLAWFGMTALAVANGAIRDYAYRSPAGDLAAHQISTVTLLILLAGYILLLARVRPIRSARQAWTIGAIWFVMTEAFEIGMGLAAGASRSELLQAYDVFEGQVWIFIPLWVLIGPYVFYRYGRKK